MVRNLVTVMALVAIVACGSSQIRKSAPKATSSGRVAEVIAASKAIVAAFGRNDPATYFSLFDPTATFIFYTTPQRLEDRAAYEKEWGSWRRDLGFRVRSCRSSNQRVQILGDVAILSHFVQTDISTTQGDTTLHERETIVFHRSQGKWVAMHEHLSPQPPGEH